MDYETGDLLAPGSPTASASTLSWLSRLPSPFDPLTISMLVPEYLQHFLILTKSQSRDVVAPIPPPTTMQNSFSQLAAPAPEPVPQSTTAVQTPLPQFLAPVLQPVTQPLILATANLIPESSPPPLPEIYPIIPPPHEVEYFSREDLLADVKNHAANNGFAVNINSSRPTKVYLVCDRGTKYRNRYDLTKETRRRTTGSRLINCPFRCMGKLENEIWKLTVSEPSHNHERSANSTAHPSLRRLNEHQKEQIASWTKAGQSPRAIWTMLRQEDPNLNIHLSDLYNARLRIRHIALAGQTSVQALLEELIGKNVFHRYKTDSKGHISHLFVAHPRSLEIFCNHHDLILLDCTYNSNRFKMPLLNMVGVTGMSTTIQVALVFMKAEREADYVWALTILREVLGEDSLPEVMLTDRELALIKAIHQLFPTTSLFLCRWHINKNVVKACKKHFPSEEE